MLRRRDTKTPQVPARRNSYIQLSQSLSCPSRGAKPLLPLLWTGKDPGPGQAGLSHVGRGSLWVP